MGSSRVLVSLDPSVGVAAEELAAAWNADPWSGADGSAGVERVGPGTFLPGVVELVVLPLAVNLVSTVVYERVRGLVGRLRGTAAGSVDEVEVIEQGVGADRVLIVRVRRGVS
jgi:hypothetical protein